MKLVIVLLLTWLIMNQSVSYQPQVQVTRTSSDEQIKETERQVLQLYNVKAVVKVIDFGKTIKTP
ncbi:hypothetical protein GCM10028805_46500 [Spirosoma harenae]